MFVETIGIISYVLWTDWTGSVYSTSSTQAVEAHRPDVDFTRHYAELGRRGKTRPTRCQSVAHLGGEVRGHMMSERRPRPDVGPLASKVYLQSTCLCKEPPKCQNSAL